MIARRWHIFTEYYAVLIFEPAGGRCSRTFGFWLGPCLALCPCWCYYGPPRNTITTPLHNFGAAAAVNATALLSKRCLGAPSLVMEPLL